jgi:hypothetical protein
MASVIAKNLIPKLELSKEHISFVVSVALKRTASMGMALNFLNSILFTICIYIYIYIYIYIQQIGVRTGCYGLGRGTH